MVKQKTTELSSHQDMANAIRALSMDAVQQANSGHPGMPLGMADVATVLFSKFLKFDPTEPGWPDRDRFVLSAGHGSMLLYSLLYLSGYSGIDIDQIKNFRKLGSRTAGHPEYGASPGIEVTTGPLGQGLATAVGMALAERNMAARFGEDVIDHYTYVIAGDGCLMEGVSQEAISLAGHLKLGKLIVLYDSNNISIDGPLSLSYSDDPSQRFKASGWHIIKLDGHNPSSIQNGINEAKNSQLPSLIICQTTIGFGAPTKAGSASSHGSPLGEEEISGTRKTIEWPHKPFIIPNDILENWRKACARGTQTRIEWQNKVTKLPSEMISEFTRLTAGELPNSWEKEINLFKNQLIKLKPDWATRVASQKTLEKLLPVLPELTGGSADLTGSNGTKIDSQEIISAGNYGGRYIHYGVREHAMAAIMNGLSLHGGIIPYGGTFLVFSDYCRPAIRLSALMSQKVIYVMTHDSIGLGEDGPTHQPVEHLASLRAIPNVNIMRPADAIETAECWQLAIDGFQGPSILALTRQGLPLLRESHTDENLCKKGAYELRAAKGGSAKAVIFATGSEVSLAIEARDLLQSDNIPTRVVSVPSWELFNQQNESYKQTILGDEEARVAVEAANSMGWESFIGLSGIMIGMDSFGASAPAKDLYNHFGITTEKVVSAIRKQLNN
jgi:transketolase